MEKWQAKPSPTLAPAAAETPIDAADIAAIDTTLQGDMLSANGQNQNTTKECTKYNRLMINGNDGTISVKGVCRQITINGDRNKVIADASMEFVLNGTENSLKYSRYPNGKQPSIVQNQPGNEIEKIAAGTVTAGKPQGKIK
jgi:hypothetical protein